jgi:hypothetical protein
MAYDFASLYPSRFSNQPEEPKVALKIIFYDEKIDKAVWCDRDRNAVLKAFRELDLAVDEIKIDEIMLMNESSQRIALTETISVGVVEKK